jgi:hypothetical protein
MVEIRVASLQVGKQAEVVWLAAAVELLILLQYCQGR